MALDFPNSPTTGQQFNPAGSNTVWQYDGTKWLPIGKSIMPMGVTDGSNAAAGQVGEYRSTVVLQGAAITITSSAWSPTMSLPLTAGDWDLWGEIWITNNITTFGANIAPTSGQGYTG